jgi:nicotinamide-nucleotide amidase
LRRQTLTPERGGYLKNANGTAVGLLFEGSGTVLVALPGPPRELQPMVRDELIPYLRRQFGVREFGCSLTLRFVGAGQSLIDQTIKDHVTIAPEVVITSLFEGSRVDFMFSLPGNTAADHDKLRRLEAAIREHLSPYIYASDASTLEDVVARQVQARGGSLVVVEMGSGGSLAAALSKSGAGARVLAGAYVAATENAMATLLEPSSANAGAATVARMKAFASVALAKAKSSFAIAVSPVEEDDKGVPSVWVVYKLAEDNWESQRLPMRDAGEITRATLTTQILDLARRQLLR